MSDPVAPNPLMLPPSDPGQPPRGQTSPLLLLHRCLRGRYPVAIALGLLLAVPFGFLGYKATSPKYRSTGIVRVQPTLPMTLYKTDEQQIPPLFESFVTTQATILKTRRVLDRAVENPALREAGWPSGIAGVARLERALQVKNERNNELIMVSVTDAQPRLAQAAINAVLGAFDEIQEELSGTTATRKERELENMQTQLSSDLNAKREEILNISLEHGTADLDPIYQSRVAELTRLESNIMTIDDQIAAIEAQQPVGGDQDGADAADGEGLLPTDEALAASDQQLATLLSQLAQVEAQIRTMQPDYLERHPDMIQLRRSRDMLRDQIESRKRQVVASPRAIGGDALNPLLPAGMSLEELKRLRANSAARKEAVHNDFVRLGRARLLIGSLKDAEADLKSRLNDVMLQLNKLRVERGNIAQGRINIAQRGELPAAAATDRRKALGLIGAMGGIGLGVGLVSLFGLMRNGFRYIDDVETSPLSIPLLGTIPDLRSGDPQHDEMAALSVHHLRNMLEQSGSPGPRGIHAITSGASGDGKTSLALALGMSFAVSGHRTLLLDADLVGRRLSRLLGLSKHPGLGELVGKATLNGEVHQTSVPNLWAIPAGGRAEFSPEKLSTADFDQLFDQLRGRFDRVIIDTGPILGSLEASLVCPQADRVILIVSAGQSPKLVQASIRRLQQLGAPCAGMVFNRARRDDFDRSVSAAPLSRSVRPANPGGRGDDGETEFTDTGSLIRALESERRGGKTEDRKA